MTLPDVSRFAATLRGIRLSLALALAPLAAIAAQPSPHIVMVTPRGMHEAEFAFLSYFRQRGVEVRLTLLEYDQPLLLQSRIRTLRPDLVYTWGTPASLAVLGQFTQRTHSPGISDIPVVFAEVADPVGSHLLPRLSVHGPNVTGVIHIAPMAAQLAALRTFRPLRKIGYLANPAEPNTLTTVAELQRAAKREPFELVKRALPLHDGSPSAADIDPLVHELADAGIDMLYVEPSTFLASTHRDVLMNAALKWRVPTFCTTQSIVRKSGCLMGLVSDEADVGRLAAAKAYAILHDGVAPANIPVEFVHRYTLIANFDTALRLDIELPLALLDVAQPSHSRPLPP
ncbi:ABC transporter substrate-binding protein [Pandoraea pnomenusa]|uniref:ABC transporter substrate-binding protein n=1 Tax=Pandoraea pnomenusa TaxID=93220 RepID=UPI003CEBE757